MAAQGPSPRGKLSWGRNCAVDPIEAREVAGRAAKSPSCLPIVATYAAQRYPFWSTNSPALERQNFALAIYHLRVTLGYPMYV